MIIRVDYLIYIYITLCMCMLGFNFYYLGKSRLSFVSHSRELAWWEHMLCQAMDRGEYGTGIPKIRRRLKRAGQFVLFHEAVQNLMKDSKRKKGMLMWFQENRPLFIGLGNLYKKRSMMEKSFYAYVVSEYKLCGRSEEDAFVSQMLVFITLPSIYCRENALYALYACGEAKLVAKAYILMNRYNILHSRKLITDGLLSFTGDRDALTEEIWENWQEFSPYYQVAFIDFFRMITRRFGRRFLPILESDAEREVKFAVLRYYRRHYYSDAEPILRGYVDNWKLDDWEFAAISALALENYPCEETIITLVHGINSRNWYIRDNASDSLLKIAGEERVLEILGCMEDFYGREMLSYKIESRKRQEAEQDNER